MGFALGTAAFGTFGSLRQIVATYQDCEGIYTKYIISMIMDTHQTIWDC